MNKLSELKEQKKILEHTIRQEEINEVGKRTNIRVGRLVRTDKGVFKIAEFKVSKYGGYHPVSIGGYRELEQGVFSDRCELITAAWNDIEVLC